MIKYSIIIPAYNAKLWVKDCVNSIIRQNRDDVEILVCADGCTDTLAEILKLPVRVFYSKENAGCYMILNSLLKYAKGERLIFFGADDMMRDGFINEIDTYEGNVIRFKYANFRNPDVGTAVMNPTVGEGVFCVSTKLILSMNGFCTEFVCGMDTEFRKRLEANKIPAATIRNGYFLRRLHDSNLSTNRKTGMGSEYRNGVFKYLNEKEAKKDWSNPSEIKAVELIEYNL